MNFDLKSRTILLTIAGSRLYGIHTKDSDVDIRGICIPPKEFYLGYGQNFEQADKPESVAVFADILNSEETEAVSRSKLEGSVYELRKFVGLATDANPNILELLYGPESSIRLCNDVGEKLRENRHLFLSAKANFTHRGYAVAQLKRIRLHRKWLLDPPPEPPAPAEELPISRSALNVAMAAVQKQLDGWELDLSTVISEADRISISTNIQKVLAEIMATTDSRWKCGTRAIGFDDNMVLLLEQERKRRDAQDNWNKYLSWKKSRNPERAALEAKFGFDCKHAAHLFRLLNMAKEILETGLVNVDRRGIDADQIQAVRRGDWTYEQIEEYATKMDAECEAIYRSGIYKVPKQPDRARIQSMTVELIDNYLNRN